MSCNSDHIDEIKRKLRSLKKLEIKIRFGGSFNAVNFKGISSGKPENAALIWDDFFYKDGGSHRKAKYSLEDVASLNKEDYRNIVDEFFFRVYYKYYTENGITGSYLYNPEILSWMGLPPDAGSEEIKKKFRELAKKYHPDTGGDESRFIELMENYHKLVE
jgi:hypothetical protein